MRRLVAIDPGASGGIAWIDQDGIVQAVAMPDGMTAQIDFLRSLRASGLAAAVIERVGTYMPGNSGPAAATFARHCGHLDSALYCLGYATESVLPSRWQKIVPGLSTDKKERKAQIREAMARRHPHLRVTLKTADALGLLAWAQATLP